MTGSSGMPTRGAKHRETKSYSPLPSRAVTITARVSSAAMAPKSGRRLRTSSGVDNSARWSWLFRAMATGDAPSASARPGSAATGSEASAGKSIQMVPSDRAAVSTPLAVWKLALVAAASVPVSHNTCALASVACPHNATSVSGVNHRRAKCDSPSAGARNAVSERFISAATDCIHDSSAGESRMHTAAGLPRNGSVANASTWKSGAITPLSRKPWG